MAAGAGVGAGVGFAVCPGCSNEGQGGKFVGPGVAEGSRSRSVGLSVFALSNSLQTKITSFRAYRFQPARTISRPPMTPLDGMATAGISW